VPTGADFGVLLREYRLAAGLTQEDVAGRSGLSVRAISGMEQGRTEHPHRRSVGLLADALKLGDADRAMLLAAVGTRTAPRAGRPAQLPPDIPEFSGRTAQIRWLSELLTGAPAAAPLRIAAVTGAGGMGKSALALHVAHQMRAQFPDGQLFIELRGSSDQPLTSADALARLLRHLGLAEESLPRDDAELAAEFRSRVADRRMLIVLDDARDAAQVRPLLPGTAGSAVMVTSRGWLAGLEGCRPLALEALDQAEALALFAEICGADRATAEPEATGAVLAACGGLPLAVRIAASRLISRPNWDVASLASRLADEHQRLAELQAGDLAVRATFQVSYELLPGWADQDTARAFRLLGLWPGPDIGRPAAAALLGTDSTSAGQLLEKLVDVHLLEAPAPGRYRFHDLIRVFAAERAAQDERPASCDQALRRLLSWYLHSTQSASTQIMARTNERELALVPVEPGVGPATFADTDAAVDWSDRERAGIVAAVTLAARREMHEVCAQLAAAAWPNFLRKPWDGWISVLQVGIDSAALSGDDAARAWLLTYMGAGHVMQGAPGLAIDCLDAALPLSRQAGERLCEATAMLNLAIACMELKRHDEAIAHLETALILHRALGSRHEGSVMMNLGILYVKTGRVEEGAIQMEQALAVLNQSGTRNLEGLAHAELSGAYRKLGRIADAIDWASSALEISRRIASQYQETAALQALGLALAEGGDAAAARSHLASAHALAVTLGIPEAADIQGEIDALDPAAAGPAASAAARGSA
jgi:tetratricopeptide (TPR) repeat protein/transcriptional regulator with XRE-family HTH domain